MNLVEASARMAAAAVDIEAAKHAAIEEACVIADAMTPAARECGSCSACCKLLQIDAELAPEVGDKAAGRWCKFCTKPGCGIYAKRPSLCRDFSCQWLLDPTLGDHWYPPVAGMLLTFDDESKTMFVVVDPDRPDAHLAEPYRSDIARMTRWGRRAPEPFEVVIACGA
jgi:hypothetical protein